jgi:hypothetical protein
MITKGKTSTMKNKKENKDSPAPVKFNPKILVGLDVDKAAAMVLDNKMKVIKVKDGSSIPGVAHNNTVLLYFDTQRIVTEVR